jgi:hypothetical protein
MIAIALIPDGFICPFSSLNAPASEARGVGSISVGNKPNPVSSVGSVDTASWKYKREDLVPTSFQVSLHFVEYHPSIPTNNAANIFPHNVARLNLANNSKHCRPEVSVILFSKSLTGD